ncbi:diaminopimelate epimerase [Flavobacterium sp. MAH-1]|uniref:Diaminopimelate epimerase n=1 Tax=Flavobacterium agri TaxID=2743471 RepID=A0A7Y8Y3V7_9FLAO|nr:diaminopimelate epimerase [Flavobacterium agri]NUY82095.1 diaminopimelate epimerase [Flavobacterium agri]NYA72119.1 diaminopimelate epimerase [Flavobacterium agri]
MEIAFSKYQGTGNDFVMIDNRSLTFPKNDTELVARLCDRRFGIGGDGLLLLEDDTDSDFKMVYYNSDGNLGSMCGNGGRCLVAFAKNLGLIDDTADFIASDGPHYANVSGGIISLQMKDVDTVNVYPNYVFLDTGSPHHIELVDDLKNFDVFGKGKAIRYGELYGEKGSNVNFVKPEADGSFSVRTYERGVEDETLSCGTGVTAVAIAMYTLGKTTSDRIRLNVQGGQLEVSFSHDKGNFTDVFLIGPAAYVFDGVFPC